MIHERDAREAGLDQSEGYKSTQACAVQDHLRHAEMQTATVYETGNAQQHTSHKGRPRWSDCPRRRGFYGGGEQLSAGRLHLTSGAGKPRGLPKSSHPLVV